MPGRLIMEQHHTLGPHDWKKEGGHAEGGETAHKKHATAETPGQNGNSGSSGMQNTSLGTMDSIHGLPTPPELDQSWRESDANKSMGVLVERLAQQCMGDLSDALTQMADVAESAVQANGIEPHPIDKSEGSVSKKRTLMEFASNQRDRFIKTLVLSDWARNADDMARLVDIKVWQEKQVAAQRDAQHFIGVMKTDMAGAKMPNPNIEGALELLATGKASRFPDLGYLPARRLTAKQLLQTLHDMNVTLATRLNLHEELPIHFNDFSIANGRATFTVPHEFEVDLTVADEDPTTPFYFIDIRFLFNPNPTLADEGLRHALEGRANLALAADGPKGCYELLHSFVLTHKINTLWDQTVRLLREKWFDCLSIDMQKRVLIIQYWSGMPGPKCWLEIGVSTGTSKSKSRRARPATPQIDVRWFRKGKEVIDDTISINWQKISAESVLADTTARHVCWTLKTIEDRLQQLSDARTKLTSTLTTSASTAEDCSLALSLPGLRSPLTVRFSGVTGKWSLSPPCSLTARVEHSLNTDSNADPAPVLIQLLCSLVQDRVNKASDLAGWKPIVRTGLVSLPQARVIALFGPGVISRSIFRCSTGWGDSWALIVTFGLAGERWFATRLEKHKKLDGSVDSALRVIAEVRPISANFFAYGSVSRAQLLRVEKLASAEIAMAVLTHELDEEKVRYKVERTSPLANRLPASDAKIVPTAVVFDAAALGKATVGSPLQHFKADVIRLTHTGVFMPEPASGKLAEMRHSLRLTAKPGSLGRLQAYLTSQSRDADIAMNLSGALALQVKTPFGQPCMKRIQSRLEACSRFNEYLGILAIHQHEVLLLSLEKFSFVYSKEPRLTATLKSAGRDGGFPVSLKLHPTNRNPQNRARVAIQDSFNYVARQNAPRAFITMVRILAVTLPAHQAFEKIEASQPVGTAIIHVHNSVTFNLEYKAPLPACKIHIHLRNKGMKFTWNVSTPLIEGDGRGLPDSLSSALLRLCQDKGEGWFGDGRSALVIEGTAIAGVLMKIDETVRDFGGGEASIAKSEADGVDVAGTFDVKLEEMKRQQSQPQHSQGHDPKFSAQQQQSSQWNSQPTKQQQQRPAPPGRKSSNFKKEIIELD